MISRFWKLWGNLNTFYILYLCTPQLGFLTSREILKNQRRLAKKTRRLTESATSPAPFEAPSLPGLGHYLFHTGQSDRRTKSILFELWDQIEIQKNDSIIIISQYQSNEFLLYQSKLWWNVNTFYNLDITLVYAFSTCTLRSSASLVLEKSWRIKKDTLKKYTDG